MAVGDLSEYIARGARESGVSEVYRCEDKEAARAILPKVLQPDCTVLVKASRGMKLEELTACLMELTQAE